MIHPLTLLISQQTIWKFPEIGVPPVIIHLNGIFPYQSSIMGYPYLWKPPNH